MGPGVDVSSQVLPTAEGTQEPVSGCVGLDKGPAVLQTVSAGVAAAGSDPDSTSRSSLQEGLGTWGRSAHVSWLCFLTKASPGI